MGSLWEQDISPHNKRITPAHRSRRHQRKPPLGQLSCQGYTAHTPSRNPHSHLGPRTGAQPALASLPEQRALRSSRPRVRLGTARKCSSRRLGFPLSRGFVVAPHPRSGMKTRLGEVGEPPRYRSDHGYQLRSRRR